MLITNLCLGLSSGLLTTGAMKEGIRNETVFNVWRFEMVSVQMGAIRIVVSVNLFAK